MNHTVSPSKMTHLAIFASGTGTNAQKIIEFFKNHPHISVSLIVANNPNAGVLRIAETENIPTLILDKNTFFSGDEYIHVLQKKQIHWIILAGFLWKIPKTLIEAFPQKIINIHPALLPKYGGKGMYGKRVHEAVIQQAETESGISIHLVDEFYDHGELIFQAKCNLEVFETPESLARKVQALEHTHFAPCIESYIEKNR